MFHGELIKCLAKGVRYMAAYGFESIKYYPGPVPPFPDVLLSFYFLLSPFLQMWGLEGGGGGAVFTHILLHYSTISYEVDVTYIMNIHNKYNCLMLVVITFYSLP